MNTGMQRSVVLRDLRKSTIDFPGDFDFEELSNQHQIIKNLLNHVPKERFSCMELLQSSLVPASVEGEYISEELLRVVRQRNPVYFSRLINALYAQSVDKHKDFAYDFNSTPGFDQTIGRVTALVHSHALKIFLNHGAIRIVSPPIIPKTDQISRIYGAKKPVEFIDVNGDVVQLLYDLTVPFARSLSQNTEENIVFPLKRYSLERVYRQNITGGQPVAVEECDYDVVFEDLGNSMVPESEVIKVVFEILSFNGVLNVGDYTIRINHMKNLNIIFGNIGIPLLLRKPVLDILQQLHHPLKVGQVKQCLVKLGIDIYMIDKLLTYDKSTAISDSLNLSRDTEINQTLTTLTKNIRALGIKNKITFDPLLVYNPNVFESFVFQIVKKTTKYDIFAAGGRYDTLLYKFVSPFAKNKPMHAVGVNIALSKFVSMVCGQYLDDERRTITKADVLVTFMGNKEIMVLHQLSIISELWSSGISADLSFLDLNTYNNLDTQRQGRSL
jgi:translation initiation factor 2-alpha kinase 4